MLSFDSGEKIVIENFYTEHTGDAIPDFVVEDTTIDGREFFKSLGDKTLIPAAGGESASGDGDDFGTVTFAIKVDASGNYVGEYTFTRSEYAKGLTGELKADYTITDKDGDVANIGLTITLSDKEPVLFAIGKTFTEGSPDVSGMYRVKVGENFTTNAAVAIAAGSGVEPFGYFEVDGAGVLWFVADKELVGKLTPDQVVRFTQNITISVDGEAGTYTIVNSGLELRGSNLGDDYVTFHTFNGGSATQSGTNFGVFEMKTSYVNELYAKGAYKNQAQADFGYGNDVVVVNNALVSASMYLGNGNDTLTIGGDDRITVNGSISQGELLGEHNLNDGSRGGNDSITIDVFGSGGTSTDVWAQAIVAGEAYVRNGSYGGTGHDTFICADKTNAGHEIVLNKGGTVSIDGAHYTNFYNFEGIGGGAGNDTLDASNFCGEKVSFLGGKGDDTFIIGVHQGQTATITDFGYLATKTSSTCRRSDAAILRWVKARTGD